MTQQMYKGKPVIDKGTVLVNSEEDKQAVLRYIMALAEGDETYKPTGLKFKKDEKKPTLTGEHRAPEVSYREEEDVRRRIKYLNKKELN